MSAQIVIVEHRNDWPPHYPDAIVVSAKDYISRQEYLKLKDVRIINLCRSYRYLSLGYYCSLLAEARKHRILPMVRTITDLSRKSIYSLNIDDLDATIQRSFKSRENITPETGFEIFVFFGQCEERTLQILSRQLFDLFRCPVLKVEFKLNGRWQVAAIKPGSIQNIPQAEEAFFLQAYQSYIKKRWLTPRTKLPIRYDLAILHNPEEKLPPSNHRALQKFKTAGKNLGLEVDLIEKKDYARLAEYDALFIRETTRIEHHTYRFSKRAESEGMVVIDDPDSILKCTNKIYLAELLAANKIPTPKTMVLNQGDVHNGKTLEATLTYPMVLKIPDSSFSLGVHRVQSRDELKGIMTNLFSESDLILAQEFVYTEFDWRIGILNRKALFACQYFMIRQHWQILKHGPSGRFHEGDSKTWAVEDAPQELVDIALKAANLIGDGFYGVDLKQTDKKIVVMEINDNPNVDAGVEDEVLGDRLYQIIIEEFVRRMDQRKIGETTG